MGFWDFQWADDVFLDPWAQVLTGGAVNANEVFGSKNNLGPESMRPEFPGYGSSAGNLPEELQLENRGNVNLPSYLSELDGRLSGIDLDPRALNQLRDEGLRSGPSAWGNLMKYRQGVEESEAIDKAARSTASSAANARSAIAARGGLSSGGAERVARDAMRLGANSSQTARREGMLDRANIDIQDETNRQGILKSLPGMELAALEPEFKKTSMWANAADTEQQRGVELGLQNRDYAMNIDKYNIGNSINDRDKQREYDLGKYKEDMASWAAERQAQATANADKGKK